MCKRLRSLLMGLLLLPLSTLTMAEVIHWELSSHDVPDYMDEGFTLSGGFDFNTITKEIFNITVNTTASGSCFTCNDYAGGTGTYSENSEGASGVIFSEVFQTGDVVDRSYNLIVTEPFSSQTPPQFNWNVPGSFSELSFRTEGFLRLDDPFDPSAAESLDCVLCATAVGTLVPVPEPETYLMMLVGLLGLGWKVKSLHGRTGKG